jgi:hypothetical protein
VIEDTTEVMHEDKGIVQMSIEDKSRKILNAERIIIVACGILACRLSS